MTVAPGVDLSEDRLFVMGEQLFYILVCAPKSWDAEKVQRVTNENNRCGTLNGWRITEPNEINGLDANPCPCHDSEDRQHWYLSA